MPDHEYYRELSALAAIGQLSLDEDRELNEHLRGCADCRKAHSGYARVIQHQMPQADSIRWRIKSAISRPGPDMEIRERFVARARAEGIDLSAEAEQPRGLRSHRSRQVFRLRPALAAVSVVVIASLGVWVAREYRLVLRSNAINTVATQAPRENETLHTQLASLRQTIEQRTAELERMKQERTVSRESLLRLEKEVQEARDQMEQLSRELQKAESENASLSSATQQKDTVIADLNAKNDKLHRTNADNLATRILLEAQVRDLTESLQQQAANFERERQLMVVSKDVRELMGARNLHILDVHDTDGDGRSAKAFGRVFYAEGQSLIFYAFDLPSGKLTPAKYTFQAWGQKESVSHSVRNLGTFAIDDHVQGRWVLKVENPTLLRGIDSVFVTAETLGDAREPRGKKLLYAYIVGQPNHP